MKKQKRHCTKCKVFYLDSDEISRPLDFVEYFFDASSLPDHLDILRQWRDDIAFETRSTKKRSPSDILYDFTLTIKLVEAAWILKKLKMGNLKIGKDGDDNRKSRIKEEKKNIKHYPYGRSFRELVKPSIILKNVFSEFKLEDYQRILHGWLSDAMSSEHFEENLSKYEVIKVYENLIKIFETMWLIVERSRMQTVLTRSNK